ncbi:MAG TPA: hypothetical protein PLU37_03090, partial [Chitinophagaceae bacterium]|nr:hypothetical protein [Chitinophagaceae bacterium]
MKTKILPLSYYLRALFVSFCTLVFFLLSIVPSYCQSETHNFTTYDTTFSAGGQTWIARISRPVNMFTPNHPDTASRPALITMPGVGEVGTNYANLTKYGPHYWLNNGWDGSIVTGSGTHYPILITVISSVANPRVNRTISMLQFILSTYHIKSNSVHLAGLSMGAFTWAGLINGQLTNGGEEGMKMVTSLVLLQGAGQGATSGIMGTAIPYDATGYTAFGHWASKYGGTFFGLEGTSDTRNVWQPRDNINDSVPGAGYFAFENIGSGAHCCWNTMYDPNRRNWKNQQNDLGTNIVWNTNHHNSMGSYQNGWNVFEWMFRQGDTTLISGGATTNTPPVANAGSDQLITLPTNLVTLNGSGTDPDGSIVSYQWTKITGPSTFTIVSPTLAQTVVNSLVQGIYSFELKVTDNQGAIGRDTVQITVNAAPPANQSPSANAGNDQVITLPANTITLNGSGTDPDGTIVSYQWIKLTGPSLFTIVNPTLAQTVVNSLVQGVYTFKLTVTDNQGATGSDTVQVTVNAAPPANQSPSANAGNDQVITLPTNTVTLIGSGTDPDGTITTYQWTKLTGPSQYSIVSASQALTVVNNLVQGIYTFKLTVTDNQGATGSDTVTVTVNQTQTNNPSPSGKKIAGPGEYQTYFIDQNGYLWGIGNIGNIGTNNVGQTGRAYRAQVTPLNMKFLTCAGGLHGGAAVDTTGHVWVMGDNDQYQHGIGNNTQPIYTPSKILIDSAGNEFGNVKSVAAYFVKNLAEGYNGFYAIKNDGTLWGWGRMVFGMRGDGTAGADKPRPVQIVIPGNRKVQQIVAGQFTIILCEDGTVWVWGQGASNNNIGYSGTTEDKWSPHQLTGLSSIKQIAGGMLWNYALDNNNVLYGWGAYGERMGNANGLPIYTPTILTNITNN